MMKSLSAKYVVATAAIVFAASQTAVLIESSRASQNDRPQAMVLLAHGADRAPNESADDWVSYADHVVVASIAREDQRALTAAEKARGEGIILRDLTFSVEEVVWSSEKAARSAPDAFSWIALGWNFKAGARPEKTVMSGEGEPRLEPGHSYIMALQWQPARCTTGDFVPGQWRGLGSATQLPYDNSTIGEGEFEGRLGEALDPEAHSANSVARLLAGKDSAELGKVLRGAASTATRPVTQHDKPCRSASR